MRAPVEEKPGQPRRAALIAITSMMALVQGGLQLPDAFAQWLPNGTPVCLAPEGQFLGAYGSRGAADFQRVAPDGAGGFFSAWVDGRGGADWGIFAQRMSGSGIPYWQVNGIEVSPSTSNQEQAVIASDGQGGVILAWVGYGSALNIFAQRLSADGEALWPAEGVPVSSGSNLQNNPTITSDGNGGAFIAWEDYRTNPYGDVYVQHIGGEGTPLWPVSVVVSGGTDPATAPYVVLDGMGGAFVAWATANPNSWDWNLYAQRLTSTGSAMWQVGGVPVCTAPGTQQSAVAVPDGFGGIALAWQDYRDDGSNARVFAQRVDGSGGALWSPNGVRLSAALSSQSSPAITVPSPGAVVVAWQEPRGTTGQDILAQYVDPAGNRRWGSFGQAACGASGAQMLPSLAPDQAGGVIAVWRDSRSGANQWGVYAQRLNAEGVPQWLASGVSLCAFSHSGSQTYVPQIIADLSGGAMAIWDDQRSGSTAGDWHIYAQRVSAAGSPGTPGPTPPLAPSNLNNTLLDPPRASLTWEDNSNDETSFEIQVQIDNAGSWINAATLAANSTFWTSGVLDCGHTYEYRIKSCNGLLCSSWLTSSPVSVGLCELSGAVEAAVLERPYDTAPTWRALSGVRVALLRGGSPVGEGVYTAIDGTFSMSAAVHAGDKLVTYLAGQRLQVVDNSTGFNPSCAIGSYPSPSLEGEILTGSNEMLRWPADQDGVSGDGPNLWYLAEQFSREYWEQRIGITPGPMLVAVVNDCRADETGGGGTSGPISALGQFAACSGYSPGSAQVADVVYHEFGHRMVIQALGHLLNPGNKTPEGKWVYLEAAGMDEAFADYFTAAFTQNSRIHGFKRNGTCGTSRTGSVDVRRNLSQVVPRRYSTCPEDLDAYFGATILGGALWEIRETLISIGVNSNEIDREVFASMTEVGNLVPSSRTFLTYRQLFLNSATGRAHESEISSAFDRHNIKQPPDEICTVPPVLQEPARIIQDAQQVITVSWRRGPGALFHRLWVKGTAPASGFGLGMLAADSLVDSSFVYTHPDTTARLSFVVTAVDSAGNDGPASEEARVPSDTQAFDFTKVRLRCRISPNPGRESVHFLISSGVAAPIVLQVFDVAGRVVRWWRIQEQQNAQEGHVLWDGKSQRGQRMSSGVYFVQALQGASCVTQRMVLLH